MTVQGVLPAMPALQEHFGIGDAAVGWFTLVYVLPGVVLTIPLGRVMARMSRRVAFGGALALYAVTGLLQAFASSYEVLLGLRVLQGVGFAAAMPLTVVVIGEAFEGLAQVRAFATRQMAVTAGEFALPVVGGLLGAVSWRGPLLAQSVTFALVAAALVILDDRRSAPPDGRRVSSAAAVRAQRRGSVVMAVGFTRFFLKFALLGYLPVLLVRRDISVAEAGVVVAVSAGCAGLMATRVPWALRRLGASRLTSAGAVTSAASLVGFVVLEDLPAALALGVVFGIGDGILAVMQDAYLTRAWREEHRAAVAAVGQTARNSGKLAAPLVMTVLVAAGSVEAAFLAVAAAALGLAAAFAALGHLDDAFRTPAGLPTRDDVAATSSAEAL